MYRTLYVVLLLCCGIATADTPNGQALFEEHCAACHGLDGMGGVGTPLALPSFIDSVSNGYLSKTIRHGRPGRIMPGFQKLTINEVESIVGHMRGRSDKPAPEEVYKVIKGDPDNGKVLFTKHCAECHGKEGEGGQGTGVTFSRPRDLPIIPPALNNPGFLASASNQMIKESILNGREGTPMDPYRGELTGQQINDITLFIRSLEGKARPPHTMARNAPATLIVESPYNFEDTVKSVKNAASATNFVIIRTDFLEHGLKPEGKENKKLVFVDFCSFSFLNDALKIDPRIGIFLPCRVSISEVKGKVYISSVNPEVLGALFNNTALYDVCRTMTDVYKEILDEATL